jgi:hypothetical protein
MSVATTLGWDAVAQPAAARALRTAIANDQLGHAFLLVGPRGVGQHELSRTFGAALNCEVSTSGDPCGACETCRRFGRDTHTALITFEPEGANHLVGSVREDWIPTASRSLTEGRRRLIRIVAADRMNEAAQNAFLKALEEPPPSTIWVLEAESDQPLLDTILSRCRRLDLVTWGPGDLMVRAAALDLPESRRPALVRAAMGSPDRLAALARRECPECGRVYLPGRDGHAALECLNHEVTCSRCGATFKGPIKGDVSRRTPCDCTAGEFDAAAVRGVATELDPARERHLDVVRRLGDEGPGAVATVARDITGWAQRCAAGLADQHQAELERLAADYGVEDNRNWPPGVKTRVEKRHHRQQREARREAIDRFLDDLGSYLRDLLAVHAGGAVDTLVNLDHATALRRDAARLSVEAAIRGLADISRCREALTEFNGQPELQLERILTPMAAALFATR